VLRLYARAKREPYECRRRAKHKKKAERKAKSMSHEQHVLWIFFLLFKVIPKANGGF
jgi:hypothetical protein